MSKEFLLRWGAALLLAWAGVHWLFLPLLPFLIALGAAVVIEPGVQFLRRRLHFRRGFSAVVLSTALVGGLTGALGWLGARLTREAALWLERLPRVLRGLPLAAGHIRVRFHRFLDACPHQVEEWVEEGAAHLAAQGPALMGRLSAKAISLASDGLSHLPGILLFAVTTLLALYYTAIAYPDIAAFVKRQLPEKWQGRLRGVAASLRSTLFKWLKAQALLLCITFGQLLAGFLLLRLPYALLAAGVITLVDALPVLGAGTVLIPWGLLSLLTEDPLRGVALLALYALVTLVRSLLEPKLVAAQAGLPPLAALMAMYLGWRLFGLGGMLLLPLALLFVKQLQDGGFIRLWR